MALDLSWEIEGEKQLARRMRGITTNITNFQRPFKTAANMLENVFSKEVFTTRGAIIGEKWARLSPATVASKARRGYPSDPLIATGKMQRGFRSLVTSERAVIYNTADYFKYHQSKQPRNRIPRRVMMKLADVQKQDIIRIFQAFIRQGVK